MRTGQSVGLLRRLARAEMVPRGGRALDLGAILVLGLLALLGLGPVLTGWQYLLVGGLGLVLGLGLAQVTRSRGWPPVAALILGLVGLILIGPALCLRATSGPWPTPASIGELIDTLVHGWYDLVTTLPPADGSGPLLSLVWAATLATGLVAGLLVEIRGHGVPAPVALVLPALPPVGLLATTVLVGLRDPASILLQGVVFGALVLAWVAVRGRRGTVVRSAGRAGTWRRLAGGSVMLAVAVGVAIPSSAGLVTDERRTVLRTEVAPPIDLAQFGSPLSSFRRFVAGSEPASLNLYDAPLLRISGVPAGTRIRFAALDRYDGVVWMASQQTAHALPGRRANAFLNTSQRIENPVTGTEVTAEIELGAGWEMPWLPVPGALQHIEFEDAALQGSFRYNLASSTGLVPTGLGPGDRYRIEAVIPGGEVRPDTRPSRQVNPDVQAAASFLEPQASAWSTGARSPMGRVLRIADHLKEQGYYSDGTAPEERSFHPGHYQKRLGQEFAAADLIVGNDEQYAATMALMANLVGVPARVVMGAVVPEGGRVRGADVRAWVEVQVADGSWRTLPTDRFMSERDPAERPTPERQSSTGSEVPPPAPVPPPSDLTGQTERELRATSGTEGNEQDQLLDLPEWLRVTLVFALTPLLLLALAAGLIAGLKGWRRRRRRRAARPSTRIDGAWRELIDRATDLGGTVRVAATRPEQAAEVAAVAQTGTAQTGTAQTGAHRRADALARSADARVFGTGTPDDAEAEAYWTEAEEFRRELGAGHGRLRRWRAGASPRSLRRRR